jgi:hypothetical protein
VFFIAEVDDMLKLQHNMSLPYTTQAPKDPSLPNLCLPSVTDVAEAAKMFRRASWFIATWRGSNVLVQLIRSQILPIILEGFVERVNRVPCV